jgi:hypothetical protein
MRRYLFAWGIAALGVLFVAGCGGQGGCGGG